jgi:hypothetical protein
MQNKLPRQILLVVIKLPIVVSPDIMLYNTRREVMMQ